jgi:UPF0288 family protein (methanogenesis marker protein 3)
MTIHAMKEGEIETMGVSPERIFGMTMDTEESPWSVRYFRKITGLDHKAIGTLKVHFTFEGMPMITFEGENMLAADLYPERLFEGNSVRGDVAITNMSRPQRGLVGIRLEDNEEFGPTGEESHGANMLGRFVGDLDLLMKDIKEGDIVYIRQLPSADAVQPTKRARKPARGEVKTARKPAAKRTKGKGGKDGQ